MHWCVNCLSEEREEPGSGMEISTLSPRLCLSPFFSPTLPLLACVMLFLDGGFSSVRSSSPRASAPCYGDTLCLEQTQRPEFKNRLLQALITSQPPPLSLKRPKRFPDAQHAKD